MEDDTGSFPDLDTSEEDALLDVEAIEGLHSRQMLRICGMESVVAFVLLGISLLVGVVIVECFITHTRVLMKLVLIRKCKVAGYCNPIW